MAAVLPSFTLSSAKKIRTLETFLMLRGMLNKIWQLPANPRGLGFADVSRGRWWGLFYQSNLSDLLLGRFLLSVFRSARVRTKHSGIVAPGLDGAFIVYPNNLGP